MGGESMTRCGAGEHQLVRSFGRSADDQSMPTHLTRLKLIERCRYQWQRRRIFYELDANNATWLKVSYHR